VTLPTALEPIAAERYFHPLLFESHHVTGADYLLQSETLDEPDRQLLRIVLSLALRCPEDGHSFLDLAAMERFRLADDERKDTPDLPSYDVEFWTSILKKIPNVVGTPTEVVTTPFVLERERLYLAKLYGDEREIAAIIRERWALSNSKHGIADVPLFVLLGGPGAGKTSTIAVRLIRFINAFGGEPKISMAAPTGKAALRMRTALQSSLNLIDSGNYRWAEDEKPLDARDIAGSRAQVERLGALTIHKLLGFNPANKKSRWGLGRDRRLDCDLLIIDECSMVSLELLAHLLRAIPKTAKVWFIGDPDQLASVGVGSILADIQAAHSRLYTSAIDTSDLAEMRLKKLTTNFRQKANGESQFSVADLVTRIRRSAHDSGESTMEFLGAARNDPSSQVSWIDPSTDRVEFRNLLMSLREDAELRHSIATSPDALSQMQRALSNDLESNFKQVLCVHRHGDFGVSGINVWVKTGLGLLADELWYPGRPVLVTRNDNTQRDESEKMWNGDTGVIVRDGTSLVFVLAEPGGRKPQPVARLSEHELNYAMTVHKSQGSEYNEVVVMLPMKPSRICTREMLYTAVSRAKKKVSIVGPRAVIEHMLKTPITRASGLGDRI
jgi:exodeoxyribonuclease V alpha subunit